MQNSSPTSSDSPTGQPGGGLHAQRLSAVELAAQRGIGPLSPQGLKVWHGESYPCVSCGELVRRSAIVCDQCGQDLSLRMIVKMQAHSGPWYVHEHVRPFPGVTLERLIRQAQRGVLTATTIVRGPTTYHQWRFAAETPGLSKHLGLCWNCQAKADAGETRCRRCGTDLDQPAGVEYAPSASASAAAPPPAAPPPISMPPMGVPRPAASPAAEVPPPGGPASDLARIRAAFGTAPTGEAQPPARGLPVGWIIAVILVVAIGGLLALVRVRQHAHPPRPQATPTATPVVIPGNPPQE